MIETWIFWRFCAYTVAAAAVPRLGGSSGKVSRTSGSEDDTPLRPVNVLTKLRRARARIWPHCIAPFAARCAPRASRALAAGTPSSACMGRSTSASARR